MRPSLTLYLLAPALLLAACADRSTPQPPQTTLDSRQRLLAPVEFRHLAEPGTERVHVVGAFNAWDRETNELDGPDADGVFAGQLYLAPGRHLYKFVEDGVRYVNDSHAEGNEADGYGGRNSFVDVSSPVGELPEVAVGDGELDRQRIVHPRGRPWAVAQLDGTVEVRLVTRAGDAERVAASWLGEETQPLLPLGDEGEEGIWAGVLPSRNGSPPFQFRVDDGELRLFCGESGVAEKSSEAGFFPSPPPADPGNLPPPWMRDAVFYQIFPERFANGDRRNDPPNTDAWGDQPGHYRYQGGDLAGIAAHLSYLHELGVDALYLNPIFSSPSNHKYDVADYHSIDPHFGGTGALRELLDELGERHMRLILDGVFNHSGDQHSAFQDLRTYGEASPYSEWYQVRDYPVAPPEQPNYEAWEGHGHLPTLNTDHPEVREHLFSAVRQWTEAGIDGWRLDAAEQVEHRFWQEFRRVARANSEAVIIGELWADARPWLQGDQFDGATNYRFRDACLAFFAEGSVDAAGFATTLQALLRDHPWAVTESMLNLLGSHDTPRWRTACGGNAARADMGLSFLLTWPGAPLIYYGDEVGMEGADDPDNRRAFDWTGATWDRSTRRMVRNGIRVRRAAPALRAGLVDIVHAEVGGGLLFIERRAGPDRAGVVVNRGERRTDLRLPTSLPEGHWIDAIGGVPARVRAGILELTQVGENQLLVLRFASPPPRQP